MFPFAVDADLRAGATNRFARPLEAIVDQAIAVVVFAVTDLWFGFWAITIHPLPIDTYLFADATDSLAWSL